MFNGPDVLSERIATSLVSDVLCERLHCHAEGSHITINLFQPLKQHVGCRQYHSNEEIKMAVTERQWIQETDF
jgi:hypothetical protein